MAVSSQIVESMKNSSWIRKMFEAGAELAAKYGAEALDAAEWNVPLTFDGVHFSEKGHRVFADNMLLPFGGFAFRLKKTPSGCIIKRRNIFDDRERNLK